MRVLLLAREGRPMWGVEEDGGVLYDTSIEHIQANGLPDPQPWDLVLTEDFDLDEYRVDAIMLRAKLRDGVPVVRLDRA